MSQKRNTIIPPGLFEILQKFTNDAIKTQPEDLLEWSTVYFSAMAQGKPLPVRETPESVYTTDLTPEILSDLHSQLNRESPVSKQEVASAWRRFDLPEDLLEHIFSTGCFGEDLEWITFFALCCYYLGGTIKNGMAHVCSIMNSDPTSEPPDACVPFETFHYLYTYLTMVDGDVPVSQMEKALTYLEAQAKVNNGVVKVSDFIDSHKVRLE